MKKTEYEIEYQNPQGDYTHKWLRVPFVDRFTVKREAVTEMESRRKRPNQFRYRLVRIMSDVLPI